ncbi:MAG TPA: hypothetical protein VFE05_19020 [Longimicrobiaceae bacterium]|jgi:hypothetical protein|nr:hypothetical protein [Longimicrobiaceae bacterium]
MKKQAFAGLLIALATAAGTRHAAAQTGMLPISAEVRVDVGIPVNTAREIAKTGVGFIADAALTLTPRFAVYGGYSRFNFDSKTAGIEVRDDGFDVGGKALLGTGGGQYMSFVQVGALFHNGDTGFEARLGGDYPLGGGLTLTPAIGYRKISDFDYVTAGVGLSVHL